jgi:L-aminopeptidase/D-esterase-like protein
MTAELRGFEVAVGHSTDAAGATGLTVIRGIDAPLRAGAAVFGRASGTRELHTLTTEHLVDRIDAVLLTGGSAYGLDAAAGVMRWMEERGRGFPVPGGVVPIVPAAVVFDLGPLGRFEARPTPAMAYEACERAMADEIEEGSVGVGTGATVGKIAGPATAMKGGVGCAIEAGSARRIAALAVVNALGDVRDGRGHIIAGARAVTTDARGAGEAGDDQQEHANRWTFLDASRALATGKVPLPGGTRLGEVPAATNTTLGVVIADVALTRVELIELARSAGAALFRRISPAGTSVDGDVVFALAPMSGPAVAIPGRLMELESLAVAALERAIERAVRLARGRDGIPGLAD